jgi:plastocyanin
MRIPRSALRTSLISTLVVAVLALASCGDDDDSDTTAAGGGATTTETETETTAPESNGNAPAPSGNAVRAEKVEIVEFTYQPDPVKIEEGGKVTWINRDSAPHTATADDDSFDTETLEQGKLKSETFKEPGTYPYFCEIHPDMRGTIEVVPSG